MKINDYIKKYKNWKYNGWVSVIIGGIIAFGIGRYFPNLIPNQVYTDIKYSILGIIGLFLIFMAINIFPWKLLWILIGWIVAFYVALIILQIGLGLLGIGYVCLFGVIHC